MGGRLLKKGGKSAVLHFSAESLNQMDLEEPLGLKELEAVFCAGKSPENRKAIFS